MLHVETLEVIFTRNAACAWSENAFRTAHFCLRVVKRSPCFVLRSFWLQKLFSVQFRWEYRQVALFEYAETEFPLNSPVSTMLICSLNPKFVF